MMLRSLAAGGLAMMAIAWHSVPDSSATARAVAVFLEPANCANCEYGCQMSTENHKALLNQNGDVANPHTDCLPAGTCGHPTCGSASLETQKRYDSMLDDLDKAVAGDVDATVALLRDHPDLVVYNSDRAALQIRGCRSDIMVGHLQLTPEQVAVIEQGATEDRLPG